MFNRLIDQIKNKFLVEENPNLKEDTATVSEFEDQAKEIGLISDLLDHEGGKILIKSIVDDIVQMVKSLTETEIGDTKRDSLVSDLKAKMDFYNKLSTKDSLEALRETLEEYLED